MQSGRGPEPRVPRVGAGIVFCRENVAEAARAAVFFFGLVRDGGPAALPRFNIQYRPLRRDPKDAGGDDFPAAVTPEQIRQAEREFSALAENAVMRPGQVGVEAAGGRAGRFVTRRVTNRRGPGEQLGVGQVKDVMSDRSGRVKGRFSRPGEGLGLFSAPLVGMQARLAYSFMGRG
jgi:hypothetical protein